MGTAKILSRKKENAKEWGQALLFAIVVALFVRTFFFQVYRIPTGSMRPTLMEGDHLVVSKVVYKLRKPIRGEVIVFIYPENPRQTFVKRLVGLPGERLKIEDGKIYINGKPLNSPPEIASRYYWNAGKFGNGEITIPEHGFYVLGDNTLNSKDSRYWGFVPEKNLVGKALFIFWPPWRWGVIK